MSEFILFQSDPIHCSNATANPDSTMLLVKNYELIVDKRGGGGINNSGVGLFAFIVLFDYYVTIIRSYIFEVVKMSTSHE